MSQRPVEARFSQGLNFTFNPVEQSEKEQQTNRSRLSSRRSVSIEQTSSGILVARHQVEPGEEYRSPIRLITETIQRTDLKVNAVGGSPADESLNLVRLNLQASFRSIFDNRAKSIAALRYGGNIGDKGMRETSLILLNEAGINTVSADDVLIESQTGSSGAESKIFEIALRNIHHGIAMFEGPSYPGAIAQAWERQPEIFQLDMDEKGAKPDHVRAVLKYAKENNLPVVWLTMLDGHNPTVKTVTLDRREEYVDAIKESGLGEQLLVMEDNAYGHIKITNQPKLPSLTSLLIKEGLEENAAYIESLSKSVAPGIRTSILLLPPRLRDAYVKLSEKRGLYQPNSWPMIVAEFITSGMFAEHVKRITEEFYIPQCEALFDALQAYTQQTGWKISKPDFGFFMTVKLPKGVSSTKVHQRGLEEKQIGVLPFTNLYPVQDGSPEQDSCLRLAFSNLSLIRSESLNGDNEPEHLAKSLAELVIDEKEKYYI